MKLFHEPDGGRVDVRLEGTLETDGCTCLQNFWALRVSGHDRIVLDLCGVDGSDEPGRAALVALVREELAAGAHVHVTGAPPEVAAALQRVAGLVVEARPAAREAPPPPDGRA